MSYVRKHLKLKADGTFIGHDVEKNILVSEHGLAAG
jgi:hypothetical protein